MTRTRSIPVAAAALLAALTIAVAAPATAKGGSGGGGGGGGSTPPPPAIADCSFLVGTTYADGTVAGDFNIYAIVGGCAVIGFHDDFTATVYQVVPEPGWTYRLDVRDGSDGTRVTIEYTETATGKRTSLQVEPGKTVIKQ
jgi:hypothetical protein